MKRTDIHRPKAINPADYDYVAQEVIKIEDFSDCAWVLDERRRIQEHMARTGGTYSSHEHGGNCMVCGSAMAVYTILFYHRQTNTYVRMGADCARKCDMGGDFDSNAFRQAVEDARLSRAGKRKAQALLSDAGFGRAWDIYTENLIAGFKYGDAELRPYTPPDRDFSPCNAWLHADGTPLTSEEINAMERARMEWQRGRREEFTIQDIVGRLVKYGSISDKAMAYIGTLLRQIDERPARQAQREAERAAAVDCPEGRILVSGTVLTVRTEETQFGLTTKILVQADAGWKVWGTRPSGTCAEKGDRVEFRATVERSKTDAKFGYYKRPANGQVLASTEAAIA